MQNFFINNSAEGLFYKDVVDRIDIKHATQGTYSRIYHTLASIKLKGQKAFIPPEGEEIDLLVRA